MAKLPDRDHSPSEIKARLDRYRDVAREILAGLDGKPFYWQGTEGKYNVWWAEDMGLTLVTETQVKKRGYRLKKGAQPVGSRYFTAPISRQAYLYILECQAVKLPTPPTPPSAPADQALLPLDEEEPFFPSIIQRGL